MNYSPESPTRLTEGSVSPHHATHDRKGREGKGEEWRDVVPLHPHLRRGRVAMRGGEAA